MPSIGYGTAGLGQQTVQAVHAALVAGYTLFDTAQVSPSPLTTNPSGLTVASCSSQMGHAFHALIIKQWSACTSHNIISVLVCRPP